LNRKDLPHLTEAGILAWADGQMGRAVHCKVIYDGPGSSGCLTRAYWHSQREVPQSAFGDDAS